MSSPPFISPSITARLERQRSNKQDASQTMNRLRDSFVGTSTRTTTATATTAITNPNESYNNASNSHGVHADHGSPKELLTMSHGNNIHSPLYSQEHAEQQDEEMSKNGASYKYSSILPPSTSTCASIKLNDNNNTSSDHHDVHPNSDCSMKQLDCSQSSPSSSSSSKNSYLPSVSSSTTSTTSTQCLQNIIYQIPAVCLVVIFHLMIAIPFGVSYFPIGWKPAIDLDDATATDDENNEDGMRGVFPIEGKEALGIRMFLFATIIGQGVFTFASKFDNPISIQMVENVPFCHSLAKIVISHVGYGPEALSTLMVMFGLSSIIVGIVFYTMGKMNLGRIVYFFPVHVLVGCIGGIGIYILKTGFEVAIGQVISIDSLVDTWNLWGVAVVFELVLRILEVVTRDEHGKPRWSLLSPIYFIMITPIFYFGLFVLRISVQDCKDAGYFFPPLDSSDDGTCIGSSMDVEGDGCSVSTMYMIYKSIFNKEVFDIWNVIDFSNISWVAIFNSVPTLIALTLFSLIHVPINIPAFAVSTNTEADMNAELIAHGYSNILSGLAGGLQVYMAYTQSVLYDRSGGSGRASGIAVAIMTSFLFFIGPTVATFIPKTMAATLLIHVGLDLFMEGVWDSYNTKFDKLEYAGIWLIVIVMTVNGMDAAMIAGAIAAVSTYVLQTVTYLDPIRGSMSAATLRSSIKNRGHRVNEILDSESIGRSRILVIQLQGHLFFGNCATLNENMNELLNVNADNPPWIVIMDFSLVLGIDSSAAQSILKLKKNMLGNKISTCVFVTGTLYGFPCEFKLSEELSDYHDDLDLIFGQSQPMETTLTTTVQETTSLLGRDQYLSQNNSSKYTGSHVFDSLDLALAYSENALIARSNPDLLDQNLGSFQIGERKSISSMQEEQDIALQYLTNICPDNAELKDVELLFSLFERETYHKDDFLWKQGSSSDCAKLLVKGWLISLLENEAGTSETIQPGNLIGELGLCRQMNRMSSVQCTEDAIVYSIASKSLDELMETNPKVARFFDYICITYCVHRLQHVSNRIFETRCLPI